MRKSLLAIFLTITIGFAATAQTSHQSWFYPVDSLFFTVDWPTTSSQKIMISVNGFTEETFHEYSGGIWLYNRNYTENTWENQTLTRSPCDYYFDTLVPRPLIKKVNVVRVRLVDTVTNLIKKDSTYNIGVEGDGAESFPFTVPVVFVTVDSLDAFGPQGFYGPGTGDGEIWNYMFDKYGKRANFQILNPATRFKVNQNGEIRIGAGSSACMSNRALSFKGNNDPPYLGPKTITTDIYDGVPTKYKWVKLRVGGNSQQTAFGSHEIANRIINGLNIGEVPNTAVVVFLNGSYWSLAFAQDKANHYAVERYTGVDKDSVGLFEPLSLDIYFDSLIIRDSMMYIYVDSQAVLTGPAHEIDTSKLIFFQLPSGRYQIIGQIDEGEKYIIEESFRKVMNATGDTLAIYRDALTLDSWLRFIALIDFFSIPDVITNNNKIASTPENKPMVLMEDFDGAAVWSSPNVNVWENEIVDSYEGYDGIMLHMVRNVLLKYPKTIDRLVLVWQDLYNTTFLPSRTLPIVESFRNMVMPEYGRFHNSWDPLITRDSMSQEAMFEYVKYYYSHRPDGASQILASRWMPADSFQLSDRKLVQVIMDSIPTGLVSMQFNSLRLDTSFSGLYYPKPALQISYEVNSGYDIYIKEFPDSGTAFEINADSVITITFLLRPATSLPVELSSFTCSQGSDGPIVFWQTASELNNSHFVIERSYNGTVFDSIGFVYANGTTALASEYSYVDISDITDTPVYYRLKQVDMDGSIALSDICMVSLTTTNNHGTVKDFGIFPNPTSGIVMISNPELIQEVRVTGLLGNDIYYDLNAHNIIDLSGIPSGIYFVTITAKSGQIVTKKILKE